MKYRLLFSCIFFFLFIFNSTSLYAHTKHLADVSYLVVDFKYSKKDGIKICDVQPIPLSISDGETSLLPAVTDFFTHFQQKKKWAVGIIDPPLKRKLAAIGWDVKHSFSTLLKDTTFIKYAAVHPVDPSSINSYSGIVYGDLSSIQDFSLYQKAYPGILFINIAAMRYLQDKYLMNELFEPSGELKPYKADWRHYPKKYNANLSAKIQKDMPADFYVIKPRTQALANGVIVGARHDLDTILKIILNPSSSLEKTPDKRFSYWEKNKDDTFLVEKFYRSDYIRVRHPLTDKAAKGYGYHYDATMRIAFILQNDKGKITYHSLGGLWILPNKALEEKGTLNEKRISHTESPFFRPVDPLLLKEVNAQMERAMLLLYDEMSKPV